MRRKNIIFPVITAVVLATAVLIAGYYVFYKNNLFVFNWQSKEKENIEILFTGDLMFDRGIRYYAAKNGGNEFIFEKIHPFLTQKDLVVANLEGPITSNPSISLGTAPGSTNNYFFTFDPGFAKTLFNENIRIVSLGNNHILNFGRPGLAETKKYLGQVKIGYFGAPDYPKSVATQLQGVKIAFVNYNQFADLTLEQNKSSTVEEIQKAKKYADIVVVYCHWGIEYQTKASPEQIMLGRLFIDSGADAVIGSHPHVIQPSEDYKGKKIYYSLGNFVFDQYFDENVRKGLGVQMDINKKTKEITFTEKFFYLDSNGQTILK